MMKNKFKFLFLSFLACFALSSFVACSDDDDPIVPEVPQEVPVEFAYSYECSEDLFDAVEITISYNNVENKMVSEKLTNRKWAKAISTKSPFSAKFQINYAVKKGFTPTKEFYTFGESYAIGIYESQQHSMSVPNKNVMKYLEQLSKEPVSKSHDFK